MFTDDEKKDIISGSIILFVVAKTFYEIGKRSEAHQILKNIKIVSQTVTRN